MRLNSFALSALTNVRIRKINHEQSKKHKETVAKMRKEVMLDNEEPTSSEVSSPDTPASKNKKQNNKNQKGKKNNQAPSQPKQEAKPKEAPVPEKPKPAPKAHAPPPKVEKSESDSDEDEEGNEDDYVLRSMMQRVQVSNKSNKKNKKQQQQARVLREMGAEFDKVNEAMDARVKSQDDESSEDEDESKPQDSKVVVEESNNNNNNENAGGAKKKKRRRAVKDKTGTASVPVAAPAPTANKNTAKEEKDDGDDQFTCKVCSEQFLTRNALFSHIKKTKHAALRE